MHIFKIRVLCAAVAATCVPYIYGQDVHTSAEMEEVIVTMSLQRTRAETALPVNVLSGEALRENAASTLGETLKELVGVRSASFGTGVGLPIIRGQSGNRVQVLQGGVSNMDASAISPDHANSVEAVLAERIEVIRGPATLLYGNGAIGGVVNVIDNRIPTSVPQAPTGDPGQGAGGSKTEQPDVVETAAPRTAPEGAPADSVAPTAGAEQQEFGLPAAAAGSSSPPAGSPSGSGGGASGGDVAKEFGP